MLLLFFPAFFYFTKLKYVEEKERKMRITFGLKQMIVTV